MAVTFVAKMFRLRYMVRDLVPLKTPLTNIQITVVSSRVALGVFFLPGV